MLIKKELATIAVLKIPEVKDKKNRTYRYAAAAEVFELPRTGKVLVVDAFNLRTNKLEMRFFSDGKTFATCNEWPAQAWGNRNPAKLDWYSYFYSDPSDDELVISILGQPRSWHQNVSSVVDDWISDLNWEKRKKRWQAEADLKKKLFGMYSKMPEKLPEYCDENVFSNGYLFFTKKGKDGRRKARCGVCGHSFEPSYDVKHGRHGHCPACGRRSIYHAEWIKRGEGDVGKICIAERTDGNLLLRWVSVHRDFQWPDFKKKYSFFDNAYNMHIKTEKGTTLYSYYLRSGGWYRRNNGSVCEDASFVYADNLNEAFGEKYYGVDLQAVIAESGCNMRFGRLLNNLVMYPEMEYLLKAGLTALADRVSELVTEDRPERPSFRSLLGIDKQLLPVYRSMNITLEEHRIIQAYGKWVSEENVEDFRMLNIKGYQTDAVISVMKNMSIEKFNNYFHKQYIQHPKDTVDHLVTQYRDYIEMSTVLGVDLSHKSVRYPKDITEAHDRLLQLFDSVGNEEVDAAFARVTDPVVEDMGMYSYESKMFCIIVPQSRSEFIAEGQSLNHCVGRFAQYYNNHVAGTKMIFFVRRVENRGKPFFTMEVDMKTFKILQLYGYGDCNAQKHVKRFAEGFVNALKKSKEKGKKTA